MKPVAAVITLSLLLAPAITAQTRPDFSGTWKLDEDRSDSAAQAGFAGPIVWRITQSAAELTVEMRQAEKAVSITYTIGAGKPGAAVNRAATDPAEYLGYWQGETLITETNQTIQGQTVTTREVRTLARNGQEMIVERTVNVQHGYTLRGAQSYNTAKDTFVRMPR